MTDSVGIYIHVPFCLKKCLYCDFCSLGGSASREREAYVEALLREIASSPYPPLSVDTVFFGGGTPSLLGAEGLLRILSAVKRRFRVEGAAEISVEVNPATVDEAGLLALREGGFTRLSVGVQSLCEEELQALGRAHTAKDAADVLQWAKKAGFSSVNADVMFGIPKQTVASLQGTVEGILALGVDHLSAYSLILEEGTPFYEMKDRLPLPDEDAECEMARLAQDLLSRAGFRHYEISNYALPGKECRHNLKYWRCDPYIGFGAAAHSCYGGERFGNVADVGAYTRDPLASQEFIEKTSAEDAEYEFLILGLRTGEGISEEEYRLRFGFDLWKKYGDRVNKYVKSGHMIRAGGQVAFTEEGMRVSNSILVDLTSSGEE